MLQRQPLKMQHNLKMQLMALKMVPVQEQAALALVPPQLETEIQKPQQEQPAHHLLHHLKRQLSPAPNAKGNM